MIYNSQILKLTNKKYFTGAIFIIFYTFCIFFGDFKREFV